jgi:hypothetical protein
VIFGGLSLWFLLAKRRAPLPCGVGTTAVCGVGGELRRAQLQLVCVAAAEKDGMVVRVERNRK